MENSVIIIMLKNKETGQLEKELGVYSIEFEEINIFSINAMANESDDIFVNLCLTCERDVEDWEYDAIFDYYDYTPFEEKNISIKEEDGHLNPVWQFTFKFSENPREVESKILEIVQLHEKELKSVYEAIVEKKGDYFEE